MPRRPAKAAVRKTTAVPGGISERRPEANANQAVQKQRAPNRATRPTRPQPQYLDQDAEFFDLAQEDETDVDDGSSQTNQARPQVVDPLFNPAPSLRTRNTRTSNRSGQKHGTAYDIEYFFVLTIIEENENGEVKKRVCKVCGAKYEPITSTSTCRSHLRHNHSEIYDKAVLENSWHYPLSTDVPGPKTTVHGLQKHLPPFSHDSFIHYLVRFIVADDQSIRVVECPEFRDLCLLLCRSLKDSDIPHRDKLREAIIDNWHQWFDGLKRELAGVTGRISFTADAWSSGTLSSYLALTAHWVSEGGGGEPLSLKTALIGFHRLTGKHTGKNLARIIFHLLDRAGLTSKIGYFTLDNAENNATAMHELQSLLWSRDPNHKFNHLKNRVRCFPHIINICVSHVIASCTRVSKKHLESIMSADDDDFSFFNLENDGDDNDDNDNDDENDDDDSDDDDDDNDNDDGDRCDKARQKARKDIPALKFKNSELDGLTAEGRAWFSNMTCDPINRARRVVRILHSSDQRRQAFKEVIKNGNACKWFNVVVPDLEPLRDVKTRWDSTYAMIERLLKLRPAIDLFFNTEVNGLLELKLTDLDWGLLEGIWTVLCNPHQVQQAMSSESMPVLSSAVGLFEVFMSEWEELAQKCPKLSPLINVGLKWAKKYYSLMDNTDAYIVTMVLNPCIRFRWIEDQWDSHYFKLAETTMLNLMAEYRSKHTSSNTSAAFRGPAPATPRKSSTPKKSSGLSRYSSYLGFESKMDRLYGHANKPPSEGSVEAEFRRYVDGLSSARDTDILRFWEINRSEFPTLFAIALDYLPIQASAVPCERVFSSAKETDTLKRNRIHPMLMEVLQTLKFSLKKDRGSISFTEGWKTARAEMEAQKRGKDDMLVELLTGDRQTTTDMLLNIFDDEQVESDGDN